MLNGKIYKQFAQELNEGLKWDEWSLQSIIYILVSLFLPPYADLYLVILNCNFYFLFKTNIYYVTYDIYVVYCMFYS